MEARIKLKNEVLDPQGEAVRGGLDHLGFRVSTARVGRVIDLELEAASTEEALAAVEEMCRSLLANPLIESYEIVLDSEGAR